MFRSVFARMMTTYMVLLLVVLIIYNGIFLTSYRSYIYKEKEETMMKECSDIGKLVQEFAAGSMSTFGLQQYLSGMYKYLQANVLVYTNEFKIVMAYPSDIIDNQNGSIGLSKEAFDELLLQGSYADIDDLQVNKSNVALINTALPVYGDDGSVQFVVLLNSSVEMVESTSMRMLSFLWLPTIGTMLIGVIMVLWMAKRISNPIVEMSSVSKEIAKGNFNKRVTIIGNDEIAELGENMNMMIEAIDRMDETHKDFVSNVSHDLRSPLTSIRGYIEGVLDGTFSAEEAEKYLRIALSEAGRMSRMVNDLLDLARLESGKIQKPKENFDINEVIRRVLISFENRIDEKYMDVEVDFADEMLPVMGDTDDIQRVLVNLMDNAIKFSGEGGLLAVKTWRDKDKAYIKVSDSGIGIAKNELEHIWDSFYQVDKVRSSSRIGSGLGLSIVKKIIDEHGETIHVNSQEGKGTEFVFSMKIGILKGEQAIKEIVPADK